VLAAEIGPAYSLVYSARGVGGTSPTSEGYAELAQPTVGALRREPAEPLSSVVDIREAAGDRQVPNAFPVPLPSTPSGP
jgi:hypothetical protein